jgi:hypothetical protein
MRDLKVAIYVVFQDYMNAFKQKEQSTLGVKFVDCSKGINLRVFALFTWLRFAVFFK